MLQQLAPDLWIADHRLKIMGAEFGARMTVFRLGSHGDIIPADGKAVVRKATAWLGA